MLYAFAVRPLGRRAVCLIGVLAFAAVVALAGSARTGRGDFRIDEAHKISESAFLRLWMRGEVRDPAWFASIVDRTNPPVGKYIFGAAILLTGRQLPQLPTLAVHGDFIPPFFSEELSAPYRHLLPAVRSASAVAIALTAAFLTMMLARYQGWVAAAAAFAFFAGVALTREYSTTAVFDPWFALFFMMTIAVTAMLAGATSPGRIAAIAALIGVVTALTFQTRLNGLLALLIAMPFVWLILRRTVRTAIAATVIVMSVFVATTLALNPYYWSAPRTPLAPFSDHRGVMRPMERLLQQKHDLERLVAPLQEGRVEGRTLGEKFRYLAEGVIDGVAGLLSMFFAVVGVVVLGVRWRSLAPSLRAGLLMSLAVILTMVATLPMPWSRYLLVDVAPLALLGGFAVAETLRGFLVELKRAVS